METWTTRDLPVLRALVDIFENDDSAHLMGVRLPAIAQASGLPEDDVAKALRTLDHARPPYIDGARVDRATYPVAITTVTERALRVVGQWPASDDAADAIIAALAAAAESEPDEEKRSGLRRAADLLSGIGREVLTRVVTGVASGEVTKHLPPHI